MSIDFTDDQKNALAKISAWLKRGEREFYLAGYAGTGKTTIMREVLRNFKGETALATFTGKAASVLSAKTGVEASTLHRLLYRPIGGLSADEEQKLLDEELAKPLEHQNQRTIGRLRKKIEEARRSLQFERNEENTTKGKLVVIDECSMVSAQIANDLLSTGCRVLWVGDTGQLPPVRAQSYIGDRKPDALLAQIMRQNAEGGIVGAATLARQGMDIPYGDSRDATFTRVQRGTLRWEDYLAADQVLVGTHKIRKRIIRTMRTKRGAENSFPIPGDRVICRRNDYAHAIWNGTQGTVLECEDIDGETYLLQVRMDDEREIQIEVASALFRSCYIDHNLTPLGSAVPFDFAHAITVHSAQGSEWGRVVLANDWFGNDYEKWLYTGITRAADRLIMAG